MPKPASIDDATIGLMLADEPRTFRSQPTPAEISSEDDLLCSPAHYMLLGDPGSGKTTTVKRLVRKLIKSPESAQDSFQYPVVIRLRELGPKPSIAAMIAEYLGME
jgi:predicted NACHT family NTPase